MSFNYSKEPALGEWKVIDHDTGDLAEAHFANILIKALVNFLEKSTSVN